MRLTSAQLRGLYAAMRGGPIHPSTAKSLCALGLIFDAGRGADPRDWRITEAGREAYGTAERDDE